MRVAVLFLLLSSLSAFADECSQMNEAWEKINQLIVLSGFPEGENVCEEGAYQGKKKSPEVLRGQLTRAIGLGLFGTEMSHEEHKNFGEYVTQHLKEVKVIFGKDSAACPRSGKTFAVDLKLKQGIVCMRKIKTKHLWSEILASWLVWMARAIELGEDERVVCKKGKWKGEKKCEEKLYDRGEDENGGRYAFRMRFLLSHINAGERSSEAVATSAAQRRGVDAIVTIAKENFNELDHWQIREYSKETLNVQILNY